MAAGWNAKLIVESWSKGGPTSIGLSVAAKHTCGRAVPDEGSRLEYVKAMHDAGMRETEILVGVAEEDTHFGMTAVQNRWEFAVTSRPTTATLAVDLEWEDETASNDAAADEECDEADETAAIEPQDRVMSTGAVAIEGAAARKHGDATGNNEAVTVTAAIRDDSELGESNLVDSNMLPNGRVESESSNLQQVRHQPKPQKFPKGSPMAKKSFLPSLSSAFYMVYPPKHWKTQNGLLVWVVFRTKHKRKRSKNWTAQLNRK
ncbi:hypothetical protein SADUNF_Sadunf02G0123700 [Salix dunnii]|uniref:Uncharacterized protein n=1 Tax=Salix dunnii TaxID=1413687 RepID=A0A835N7W5_9ROSI|nr:hypothetical protein SADUNF_Sadunf02G0123700 [Salix dunnii]